MCIFCERAHNQLNGGLSPAEKREAELCDRLRETRIRATIITGFLGSGKTTFLNFVLKSLGHGQKIGVVQNEFGSVSIDDKLMPVERSDTEVVVMPNGCLCCRVRGDLVQALRRLAGAPSDDAIGDAAPADPLAGMVASLDSLIVECSGLSEVMPVAQTFFADPFVQAAYRLDGIICVCDASNFEALEAGEGPAGGADVGRLLREQLSISDVCLLNKCDLVATAQRDRISARVRAVSPSIRVVPCRQGKVNLGQVLKVNSFSLETVLSLDSHFLGGFAPAPRRGLGLVQSFSGKTPDVGASGHAHNAFGSLGLELDGVVDVEALKAWLRDVVERHGDRLIRLKGVLRTQVDGQDESRVIVQGVGGHIEVGVVKVADGLGKSDTSRLVFIGRFRGEDSVCEELRKGFQGVISGDASSAIEEGDDEAAELAAKM